MAVGELRRPSLKDLTTPGGRLLWREYFRQKYGGTGYDGQFQGAEWHSNQVGPGSTQRTTLRRRGVVLPSDEDQTSG